MAKPDEHDEKAARTLENIATASQDRRLLVGNPECDEATCEAAVINIAQALRDAALKADKAALERAAKEADMEANRQHKMISQTPNGPGVEMVSPQNDCLHSAKAAEYIAAQIHALIPEPAKEPEVSE